MGTPTLDLIYKKNVRSLNRIIIKSSHPVHISRECLYYLKKRDLTGSCFVTETPLEISGRPCCIPEMESCFLENSLYNLAILYRLVFVYLRVCICAPVYLYVSVFFFTYTHTHTSISSYSFACVSFVHPTLCLLTHYIHV